MRALPPSSGGTRGAVPSAPTAPLRLAHINALPQGRPPPDAASSASRRSCCVCLEDVNVGDKVRTLPCLHTFHAECAEEWLKKKKVCPLCQFSIDGAQEGEGGDAAAAGAPGNAAAAATVP